MNPNTLVIPHDEWDTIAMIVSRLRPNETARTPGVALRQEQGRRRWSVTTPWLSVEVDGGEGTPSLGGTAWLPSGLIIAGAELSAVDGYGVLALAVQSATVSNESGSAHFSLPTLAQPPHRPNRVHAGTGATAHVGIDQLQGLLSTARRLPPGIDLTHVTGPDLWLGIEGGHVAATVAWNFFGGSRMTARVPARTSGSATVRLPHLDVSLLLEAVVSEEDLRLEVDELQQVLWLDGSDWSAAVALTQLGALPQAHGAESSVPVAVMVDDVLDRFGRRRFHDGGWSVELGSTTVEVVEIEDAEVVRASVRLVDGLTPSPEAWAEINALNAGMVGTRVWVEGDSVRAARDVPRARLGELADTIRSLAADTADLGPILAILGAGGGEADAEEGSWD